MLPARLEGMSIEEFGVIDGYEIVSSDGPSLGNVDIVFADEASGQAEWLGVWNGIPFTHRRIVPVRGAERDVTTIRVPFTKDVFEQAPSYHEHLLEDTKDVHITQEQEQEAYALYGLEPISPAPSDGAPRFKAPKKPEADG